MAASDFLRLELAVVASDCLGQEEAVLEAYANHHRCPAVVPWVGVWPLGEPSPAAEPRPMPSPEVVLPDDVGMPLPAAQSWLVATDPVVPSPVVPSPAAYPVLPSPVVPSPVAAVKPAGLGSAVVGSPPGARPPAQAVLCQARAVAAMAAAVPGVGAVAVVLPEPRSQPKMGSDDLWKTAFGGCTQPTLDPGRSAPEDATRTG